MAVDSGKVEGMQGSHHKAWRKIAKKLRRKRIRQKLAKKRDDKVEAG